MGKCHIGLLSVIKIMRKYLTNQFDMRQTKTIQKLIIVWIDGYPTREWLTRRQYENLLRKKASAKGSHIERIEPTENFREKRIEYRQATGELW